MWYTITLPGVLYYKLLFMGFSCSLQSAVGTSLLKVKFLADLPLYAIQLLQLSPECSCKTCFQSAQVIPHHPVSAFPPLACCSSSHQILKLPSPARFNPPSLKEAMQGRSFSVLAPSEMNSSGCPKHWVIGGLQTKAVWINISVY